MEVILIPFVALISSLLTFFSGFGLGTILSATMMLFFPVDVAIAVTGIVHFLNGIFKLGLIGKYINIRIALLFGVPAVVFAALGAYLLLNISNTDKLIHFSLLGKPFTVQIISLVIGILLMIFALNDLFPIFKRMKITRKFIWIGGALSGFFGGLSGHQGALRSAFLIRADLKKEQFVATSTIISVLIDISRLGVYTTGAIQIDLESNAQLILFSTVAAFLGAIAGRFLLAKVTISFVRYFVASLLFIVAVLLILGIL